MIIANYFGIIINTLFPPTCLICGFLTRTASNLCEACQKSLPILPHHCRHCAQFLPSATILLCGKCQTAPPPFDKVYALGPYESGIKQLIRQLKFQQQLPAARALGELLAVTIQTEWYRHRPLPDLILPVPLHIDRLKERGFNQALEIARAISKRCSVPLASTAFIRTKSTLAQSSLALPDRQANMRQAFELKKNYSGCRVALVDDVMTTGSTIRACCDALKRQGVKHIDVWCCARRG